MSKLARWLGIGFVVVVLPSTAFSAAMFPFTQITSNQSADISSQFSLTVYSVGESFGNVSVGENQAFFVFENSAVVSSSITGLYFAGGIFPGLPETYSSAGVLFESSPQKTAILPSGRQYRFTKNETVFSAESKNPRPKNGVDADGEWVGFLFDLATGSSSLPNISAALADGSLQIGVHVQAIGSNSLSDSFVVAAPVRATQVAEPSFVLLLGIGLAAVVFAASRLHSG